MSSFKAILGVLGPDIWDNEGADYPQVVFDSIKDNTSFINSITAENVPESLNWLLRYLGSLLDKPSFGDVLSKVAVFLCEELQHERFKPIRPAVIVVATKVRECNAPTVRDLIDMVLLVIVPHFTEGLHGEVGTSGDTRQSSRYSH